MMTVVSFFSPTFLKHIISPLKNIQDHGGTVRSVVTLLLEFLIMYSTSLCPFRPLIR